MATLKLKGKKVSKKKPSKSKNKELLVSIAILGILMIALGVYIQYFNSILSFKHVSEYPDRYARIAYAKPSKVTIPSVDIEIPVEDADIKDGVWETSQDTASFLVKSAVPGQGGNVVIYGHNKESIFAPLTDVDIGDSIYVSDEEGEIHIYKVSDVTTVNADSVDVVLPTDYEVLTVYTCTGLLGSERLVIKALPVDFK